MSEYGIPYKGSKSNIAASLAMNFPPATHFYDLFGGGFSMTHYMLKNRANKYQHFHYNEIKSGIVDLVQKSIAGEFNYKKFKPEWISKDQFDRRNDAYCRAIWSFGNGWRTYIFGKKIEPYKKSMHMAVVFDEFDALAIAVFGFDKWPDKYKSIYQRRLYLRQKIEHYRLTVIPKVLHQFLNPKQLEQLERLEQLEQLERLERLEHLQELQQLEQLSFTALDYRAVEILPNSVVYCDIPYENTGDYGNSFDRKSFLDWAASCSYPVYISEYNISDPRFQLIYSVDKIGLMRAKEKRNVCVEKLYWNGAKASNA